MSAPRKWKTVCILNDATLVPAKAAVVGRTHYVTKVVAVITTHANAKLIKVQDSAGTPVVIFQQSDLTKAAGVPDMVEMNYGAGFVCTADKAVNVVSEASGPVGKVYVEGFTI
jgi:hypothetical protein